MVGSVARYTRGAATRPPIVYGPLRKCNVLEDTWCGSLPSPRHPTQQIISTAANINGSKVHKHLLLQVRRWES